jgi:hypothetical protein
MRHSFPKGNIPWNKGNNPDSICARCNKTFRVKPYLYLTQKHCSGKCAKYGYKISKETAHKISIANKGKPRRGHIAWNKGLKGFCAGEKHGNWIKDRTLIIGRHNRNYHCSIYKQWVKSVYQRDNYKCRISNKDCKGRIEAHHILNWKSYPELRYQTNNGITLCHAHHPRKRDDEAKLSPYFQELVASLD